MKNKEKTKKTVVKKKKKKIVGLADLRDLVDLKYDAHEKLFYDEDGYIQMIKTAGTNIFGFREEEIASICTATESIYMSELGAAQIYSCEASVDVDEYIEDIEEIRSGVRPEDTHRLEGLTRYAQHLTEVSVDRVMSERFFLIILRDQNAQQLHQKAYQVVADLRMYQSSHILDEKETIDILYNYYNPYNAKFVDLMYDTVKDDPMELIYPDDLSIVEHGFRKYIYSNGLYHRIKYVQMFKKAPGFAFLANLSTMPGVVFSLHYEPTETDQITKRLDKNINTIRSQIDSNQKSTSAVLSLQKEGESYAEVLDKMTSDSKAVQFTVAIRLSAETEEELDEMCRNCDRDFKEIGIQFREGIYEPTELYQLCAPICRNLVPHYAKTTTADTLAYGYPFVFQALYDHTIHVNRFTQKEQRMPSILLGSTVRGGGMVMYDNFTKNQDRMNYNECIVGNTGSGKTYMMMTLIYYRHLFGMQQYSFDVEGKELNKLTSYLGGVNIDCSDGRRGRINLMQVRILVLDSDDIDSDKKVPLTEIRPLAGHIRFMKMLLDIYKAGSNDISILHMSDIEKAVIEVYKKYGIDFETTAQDLKGLSAEDYPILEDVYDCIGQWIEQEKASEYIDKKRLSRLEESRAFLFPMVHGADSDLYNGYTTIDLSSSLINFKFAGLQDSQNTNAVITQYYNALSYVWTHVLSNERAVRQQLYQDEAAAVIDERFPQIGTFFRSIIKRIRKYYGGLTTASQQISDFMKPSVRDQAEALIDLSCYQFYFALSSSDIEYFKGTTWVPESEYEFIQHAGIGECYAKIGTATAIRLNVQLDPVIMQLFEQMKS